MDLSNLKPSERSKKNKKRIGRGHGTGQGTQAGRGHKGAQSRSGYKKKRGFHNPFRVEYEVVNLDTLGERFDAGTVITPELLHERGIVKRAAGRIKVLARGEISKKLTVKAHKFSGKAAEKIAAAGGAAEVLGGAGL